MVILLAALLSFAAFLFFSSTGVALTKREAGALYLSGAVLTLAFQIQVRFSTCYGFEGCGLSFAKAAVWSAVWPASWMVYLAGR